MERLPPEQHPDPQVRELSPAYVNAVKEHIAEEITKTERSDISWDDHERLRALKPRLQIMLEGLEKDQLTPELQEWAQQERDAIVTRYGLEPGSTPLNEAALVMAYNMILALFDTEGRTKH